MGCICGKKENNNSSNNFEHNSLSDSNKNFEHNSLNNFNNNFELNSFNNSNYKYDYFPLYNSKYNYDYVPLNNSKNKYDYYPKNNSNYNYDYFPINNSDIIPYNNFNNNSSYISNNNSLKNPNYYDYIWIDSDINNQENSGYSEELLKTYTNIAFFRRVNDALKFFTKIKFKMISIIVSGSLFPDFIKKLQDLEHKISSVPKIIIFTSESRKSKIQSMSLINDSFYNIGGFALNFEEVKSFLKKNIMNKEIQYNPLLKRKKLETGAEFSFDFLDNQKSNIIGILYLARLFNEPTDKQCKLFDEYLITNYGDKMKELILQMRDVVCPISLRIKYWLRAYTLETKFYRDMNMDLMKDKIKPYIPYIQLLYAGLKLNNFNYSYTNNLYRGAMIKIEEIKKLSKYMEAKQNSQIPTALIYSKAFMSFSLDINVAMEFMQKNNPPDNLVRVLYILKTEVDNKKEQILIYKNATNADLSNISNYENEREILLFPFSVYEINDVQKKENYYIVYLNILGKYKDDFKYWNKSDLIIEINQSNYIQMLQKNGLLSIITDLNTMVLHFLSCDQNIKYSLVCKASDALSAIKKIISNECPELKKKNFCFLCNGTILDFEKTLEQNHLKDDNVILIFEIEL